MNHSPISLAPWRSSLARALHRNRSLPHSRYLQLATVTNDGIPANRTVVFRGFCDRANQLKIITDTRSSKIQEIEHQPWGEICWYFTKTREQFRLRGQLRVVYTDEQDECLQKELLKTWQQLSDSARLQFAWPDPALPLTGDKQAFSPPLPNMQQPLANFCLLLLEPERVDHLELRGEPQNRWLYTLNQDRSWSQQAVNP